MRLIYNPAVSLLVTVFMTGAVAPAFADDPCVDFKWDVTQERALFNGPAASLAGGKDQISAAVVAPDHLYQVHLIPQDQVKFAVPPGKKMLTGVAYAGLAILKIPAPGSYRIAIGIPLWIDVVSNGKLVPANDFEGKRGCSAPHKIVEFVLTRTRPFVLQFSGATQDNIRVTITRTPIRKF